MSKVLIVEDESVVRLHLGQIVEKIGHEVTGRASSAEEALECASSDLPDLVLMDIGLAGERDGVEAAEELRSRYDVGIIFLTAYSDEATVKRTERVGAVGYIVKPFSEGEVRAVIATALSLREQIRSLRETASRTGQRSRRRDRRKPYCGLIGRSAVMEDVFDRIAELARIDWKVLIEGETGTGKELAARAIHSLSSRSEEPFVAVNCAGLTDSIMSSQLFGHKRGAFTGAVDDQIGLFEAANGGVLFLDEIADVSAGVQKSLLRVLDDKQVRRVGETATRGVDVRIIAATQRNLADEVGAGRFRADLLFRLRAARIQLPPLRERGEDIRLLADSFVVKSAESAARPAERISEEAMSYLMRYRWPGNVRELKNAIDHAVLSCPVPEIGADHLPPEIVSQGGEAPPLLGVGDERHKILSALDRCDGNRVKAAEMLGISRATLYRRLAALEITDK